MALQISTVELMNIVMNSERTMTVLTPSQDFYARRGDTDEEQITFIDADLFKTYLKELMDE